MKTLTIIKRTKKLFHSNLRSLSLHEAQNKIKIEEERREKEIRPPKGFLNSEVSSFFFLLLPWSLYITLGLGFSVAKTSQIYFKIKINIIYFYGYFKNIWRDIDYLINIVG